MSGSGGGKKGHEEEHEEHVNHEAWVIPYADVLTLLMALFLVLFALGQPDEEKTEIAAESFRRELRAGGSPFDLGFGTGAPNSAGPFEGAGEGVMPGVGESVMAPDLEDEASSSDPEENTIKPPDVTIVPEEELPHFDPVEIVPGDGAGDGQHDASGPSGPGDIVLADPLNEVERLVREQAEGTGLNTAVGFRREARGLVVSIVTDQVLFAEGSAAVRPDGVQILNVVADALKTVDNGVIVEGHTDSRPISTSRFPSNWELSTARATSVLRHLVEQRGFPGERIAAAGYADTRPVALGDDPASLAENRRVEIVVLATA